MNKGSNDPDHLGGPAKFCVEPKTNELFHLRRLDGKFIKSWGRLGVRHGEFRTPHAMVFDARDGEVTALRALTGRPAAAA